MNRWSGPGRARRSGWLESVLFLTAALTVLIWPVLGRTQDTSKADIAASAPCRDFPGGSVVLEPGFTFPREFFPAGKIKGDSASSVCDYPRNGGKGVNYSSANAPLSVYVTGGPGGAPAGQDAVVPQLRGALDAVFAAKRAGIYRDVEFVDLAGKKIDTPVLLDMPVDGVTWSITLVRVTDKAGADYTSYICAAASRGSVVKIRLSLKNGEGNEPLFGYTVKKISAIIH